MIFFANNNFVGKITLNNADENQSTLSIEIVELKKYANPSDLIKKLKKRYSWSLKCTLWT